MSEVVYIVQGYCEVVAINANAFVVYSIKYFMWRFKLLQERNPGACKLIRSVIAALQSVVRVTLQFLPFYHIFLRLQ